MRKIALMGLVVIFALQPISLTANDRLPSPRDAETGGKTKEVLTDTAIVALLIAGSIAIYKATGHPCACPNDLMRNGRACGGRSAWSKPGGARPLCFPTDVTADMIEAYRTTKAIPAVW